VGSARLVERGGDLHGEVPIILHLGACVDFETELPDSWMNLDRAFLFVPGGRVMQLSSARLPGKGLQRQGLYKRVDIFLVDFRHCRLSFPGQADHGIDVV